MVIEVLILGGYAKLKPVRVSLPLVPCLVDEWPGKYALPEPPLTGPEGRPEPRRHPRKRSHYEARLTVKHRLTRRARLSRREWQEIERDLDRAEGGGIGTCTVVHRAGPRVAAFASDRLKCGHARPHPPP